ncbi:MAG: hypothetical protein ACM3NH_00500 [Candidatus Saccharibacteria bacterium]
MPFNRKSEKRDIPHALNCSGRDFPFNQAGVKARLMLSIAAAPQPQEPYWTFRRFLLPLSIGSGTLAIIFALSTTLAAASNTVPGDNLYFLNSLQEKIALSLPLPAEQKADIRLGYVYQHINEVSKVQDRSTDVQIKTLKQSQEFITETINKTVTAEQAMRQKGRTKSADSLNRDLSEVQVITDQHVQRLEQLKEEAGTDQSIKDEIDQHLTEIKNARQKARQEIQDEFKQEQAEKGEVKGSRKN